MSIGLQLLLFNRLAKMNKNKKINMRKRIGKLNNKKQKGYTKHKEDKQML